MQKHSTIFKEADFDIFNDSSPPSFHFKWGKFYKQGDKRQPLLFLL